jgi:D-alanine-D-alanine ligase
MSFIKQKEKYFVWILAPQIDTPDSNLQYYYDYEQSKGEYTKAFKEIGCAWEWVNVKMGEIEGVVRKIKAQTRKTNIVVNLCDGDELNGVPGVSVIEELERHDIVYTGADEWFYRITTSKIPMKEAFDQAGVPTAKWRVIDAYEPVTAGLFREVADVLIVKPAVSAGSMGLGIKNVVSTESELREILSDMKDGYHGWSVDAGGVFVEQFIQGREFTTLVVGSASSPDSLHVYQPIERVFHKSLPEREQFLSFDRLWNLYDKEQPLPGEENLWEYSLAPAELTAELKKITIDAYKAVGGTGYGRVDIRMDSRTGRLYVLEVNAQCGLSEDEDYTSIGAILRFDKKSFTYLTIEIIDDALMCHEVKVKP